MAKNIFLTSTIHLKTLNMKYILILADFVLLLLQGHRVMVEANYRLSLHVQGHRSLPGVLLEWR